MKLTELKELARIEKTAKAAKAAMQEARGEKPAPGLLSILTANLSAGGATRLAIYGLGMWGASKGLVDFDAVTGTIDIKPFTVDAVLTFAAPVLAFVAVLLGWKSKK